MINTKFPARILGLTLLGISLFASAAMGDIIIEDAVLIDGSGRQAIANVSVMLKGNRIHEIRRGKFAKKDRKSAQVIKARGKYLVPGLIDAHIHLVGSVKVTKDGLREVALDREKGIRALNGYLYSGVTSVYDSGNVPDYIMELREQERSGIIASPRIFATGGIVTYPGSHGSGPGATLVDDWPEAKSLLDKHIARKPDMLKVTLEERGWGARPMIPILSPLISCSRLSSTTMTRAFV